MKRRKKVYKVYLAGSMENRKYEDIFYEHFYIRSQLIAMGLEVFDPLLKEDHKPGKIVGLKTCGMKPIDVYKQDLKAVEKADIVFWITGDIQSEGSITEIAWAGCINKFKKYLKSTLPEKTIVIVSPKRYSKKLTHFAGMHKNTKIVGSVESGLKYIKRRFKL